MNLDGQKRALLRNAMLGAFTANQLDLFCRTISTSYF